MGCRNVSYDADGLSAWISGLRALPPAEIRGSWDCHLIPQAEFMLASGGDDDTAARSAGQSDRFEELCTHVLDFAHIERDFNDLMGSELYRLPITLGGFKRNASPKSGKATAAQISLADLSAEAREWIQHTYRMDFALYGGLRRRGEAGDPIGGAMQLWTDVFGGGGVAE